MWWPETVYRDPEPGAIPLQKYAAFQSSDLEEARKFVSSVFCPHILTPRQSTAHQSKPSNIIMNHVPVAGLSLNYLQYGVPVDIEPGELGGFFLVQVELKGSIEARCGRQETTILPGHASVLSPSEYTQMAWGEDSAEVIVRLDRKVIEKQLSALLGRHLPHPLVFDIDMDCTQGAAGAWWRAVRFLLSELEYSANVMNSSLGAQQFEQSLICALIYGQPHNYTSALQHGLSAAAPRHVKVVEDYIHAHAEDPVTIEDFTEVAGVSARTLFAGFKQFRGTSPMKYLRDVRLQMVKLDLERAPAGQTVTEVAMKWGFFQLGRFAIEYRKTFGCSPSDTLRRTAAAR
jgi:AraC-like DNA-binding protein